MTFRDDTRDACATTLVLAAATALTRNATAQTLRMLVFLHVAIKQRALQGELQRLLPGIDVTAVGRIGDFERSLRDGTDAVLSLPPVLAKYGLRVRLQGLRGGLPEEKYSLVAVGSEPKPDRVSAVGALDLLGRDGTLGFVHSLLGATPRVERVSKVEDLLPLLQMQRVDAVLLPSRFYGDVKQTSKLVLSQKELNKPVALPAAALASAHGDHVLTALTRLSGNVARTMGVDAWR